MRVIGRYPTSPDPRAPKRAEAGAYSTRRAITASAARVNLRDRSEMQDHTARATRTAVWQGKAWDHYEHIGEIAFGYGLVANVMSRIRLYPAIVMDPEKPPVSLSDAATIERPESETDEDEGVYAKVDDGIDPQIAVRVRDLYHKALRNADIPGIMRSFALNISVPGECYLANIDSKWQLKSTDELKIDTAGVHLYKLRGGQPRDLDKKTAIGRIWREHPRYSAEAISAMLPLADDCEELRLLGRVIRSNSRARLNAGLLYVPDEITTASMTPTDEPEIEEEEEVQFDKELADAIYGAAEDETHGNTVMPVILRGPGELGKAITHIKLERAIDEFLVNRADRTLERILQGLDIPKDVVTGLANVKYSNAIQIDESLYKAHVEPLALIIADAFTDIILRPLLRAEGIEEDVVHKVVVWYDPSEVTTRPDRAEDAQRLYDAKELSGDALRAAYGYGDADKPSEDELAMRIAVDNAPPPELLQLLYAKALPTVLKSLAAAQGADAALPESLASTLSGTEMPTDTTLEPTVPGDAAPPAPAPEPPPAGEA